MRLEQHNLRIPVLDALQHAINVGPMAIDDENSHADRVSEQRQFGRHSGRCKPQGQRRRRCHRRQPDVTAQDQHDDEDAEKHDQQLGRQYQQRADQRRRAFATAEAMINRPYVADHGSGRAGHGKPLARYSGIDADAGYVERWHDTGGHDTFADINDDDTECEQETLGAQRVRAPCITAAHLPNIDAALEVTDQHRTHKGSEQIAKKELDTEFEHAAGFARKTRRIVASAISLDRPRMSVPIPLIINPSARRGRAGLRADQIRDLFQQRGVATDLILSREPGDIAAASRRLAAAGATRIIVGGGDGSVHEAINGILESGQPTALGLVPSGSGNDFAKACGIDPYWQNATLSLADRIASNVEPRRADAGRCNNRYFANGVGIGFDAIVTRYSASVRLPLGNFVYVVGLARALLKGIVTPELTVKAGGFRYAGRATLANIANGPWLGGQFRIAPGADNADGILDLVLAEPVTRLRVVELLPLLKAGTHLDEPEVRHARVTSVIVECAEAITSHLDGEVQPPASRFEIDVLPGALRLL